MVRAFRPKPKYLKRRAYKVRRDRRYRLTKPLRLTKRYPVLRRSNNRVNYQLAGYKRRKISNNTIVTSRFYNREVLTKNDWPFFETFTANKALPALDDRPSYRATNELFTLNKKVGSVIITKYQNIFTTANAMKYEDYDNNSKKFYRHVTGLHLKAYLINSNSPISFLRIVIARDKYEIFPGFPQVPSNGKDGINITIRPPTKVTQPADDTNQTDFFQNKSASDASNSVSFPDLDNSLRTITPLNPLRFQVLFSKVYKLSGSPTLIPNGVKLINQFIPYKKTLCYQYNTDVPSNDCVKMFIFTSSYYPGHPKIENVNQKICQVQGTLSIIGRSQLYEKQG